MKKSNIYYGEKKFKLNDSVRKCFLNDSNSYNQTSSISFNLPLFNLNDRNNMLFIKRNLNDIKLQHAYLKLNKALRGF